MPARITNHLFSLGIKEFQAAITISTDIFSTDPSSFSPYISSRAEAALDHGNFRVVVSLSGALLGLSEPILWFIHVNREQLQNSFKTDVTLGRWIIFEKTQILMEPSPLKAGAQKKSRQLNSNILLKPKNNTAMAAQLNCFISYRDK